MTNILLNINNFGDEFAYRYLKNIIRRRHNVLIIPFSYHEEYVKSSDDFKKHFSKTSPEMREIVNEFGKYGIISKNIRILNYYNDTQETVENKFKRADILFFTGGYPKQLLQRIDNMNIREKIRDFKGIVIGTSAGAMVQFDKFHITPETVGDEYEYCEDGLGLISGFDIEVHYESDFLHLSGVITALKENGITIYAMPNAGGVIVKNGRIQMIGNTFEVGTDDIDELQATLDEMLENEAG